MKLAILASRTALQRLHQLASEDLANLQKSREADYESPSWAYLQAHKNGRIQQLNELLTLLAPFKG
jgi:hypothetical protein